MQRAAYLLIAWFVVGACSADRVDAEEAFLVAAPNQLDFGPVLVGGAARREVVLRNESRITAIAHFEEEEAFFAVPGTVEIAPGGTASVQFWFKPITPGPAQASFLENRPGLDAPMITLRGVGSEAGIELDEAVDFGPVRVGESADRPLLVTNHSLVPLDLRFRMARGDAVFRFPSAVSLQPGESSRVSIAYQPDGARRNEGTLEVLPCSSCPTRRVRLSGQGTSEFFDVDPSEIDFGAVLPGALVETTLRIRNRSGIPAPIVSAKLIGGSDSLVAGLPAPGDWVAHGEVLEIPVGWSPTATGSLQAAMHLQIGTAAVRVPITGRASVAGLVATPEKVDLGVGRPGQVLEAQVELSAAMGGSLAVIQLYLEGTTPFLLEANRLLPAELASGPLVVTIRLQASTLGVYGATLIAVTDHAGVVAAVPLSAAIASSQACSIEASEPEVRFGLVDVGSVSQRELELRNAGNGACDLVGFETEEPFSIGDSVGAFVTLPAGGTLTVPMRFSPTQSSREPTRGTLRVATASPAQPFVDIPLSGQGASLGLVSHPSIVDFGNQPLGARILRSVQLENRGAHRLEVRRVALGREAPFTLAADVALPVTLPPASREWFAVAFQPREGGDFRDELSIYVRDYEEPFIIPVKGRGTEAPCRDCTGPRIVCPERLEGFVGSTIVMSGVVENAGVDPVCSFSVAQGPAGSASVPAATGPCKATLRPDREGTYVIVGRISDDSTGSEARCSVEVEATKPPPFFVEATWSSPDDVDLHLFHPNAGPSSDVSWFGLPWDCFFSNAAPFWDGAERFDDPALGRDDRTGTGPERITLDRPVIGHEYSIGVHWFDSSHGATEQIVTIRSYCGGTLAGEREVTLGAPHEAAIVGSVRFIDEGVCVFQPRNDSYFVAP